MGSVAIIRMKNSLIVLLLLVGFSLVTPGCGSSEKATATEVQKTGGIKPKWVTNRPTDPMYYIGVGVASKTANPTSYSIVAQRNALNELASEIQVKVKSNSMLFSFENENQYRDEFKEFIQVKTNQQIENYESVAVWENEYEYWVYYRLSKEQYQKDKEIKINKAIDMSVQVLEQAGHSWHAGNYKAGMQGYFDALTPIKPYLSEPLEASINGTKEVYLGNFILAQISQGIRVFHIKPVKSQVNTVWGSAVNADDLSFIITDFDGKPIAQVPVKFTYSEGMIRPRDGLSSLEGTVFTELKKVTSTNNLQEVKVEIDFEKMIMGTKRPDEINSLIFDNVKAPSTLIKLEVTAPSIYVTSNEQDLSKSGNSDLKKAFELQAAEMGFLLADSKKSADLRVEIESSTQFVNVMNGLNNVLLNGRVVVKNAQDNSIVYQDKLTKVKGVGSNKTLASKEAYRKAEEMISKKIVPRFYRNYTN
ncbi:LPP20 family lipoprotein [bacterium SCSIO 12643]|nr:LPP20 family lipoprotein [bacterium SCSIO 12643]